MRRFQKRTVASEETDTSVMVSQSIPMPVILPECPWKHLRGTERPRANIPLLEPKKVLRFEIPRLHNAGRCGRERDLLGLIAIQMVVWHTLVPGLTVMEV